MDNPKRKSQTENFRQGGLLNIGAEKDSLVVYPL